MKIVVISDTHNRHEELSLPDGDMLIHCGDATNSGTLAELQRFLWWMDDMSTRFRRVLYVPGNHDMGMTNSWVRQMYRSGITMIHDCLEVEGIKIFGSAYTPIFGNWSFMYERGLEARLRWSVLPEQLDLLITHGPPRSVLDANRHGERVGCDDLLEAVARKQPRYHLFGHIHESRGIETHEGTTFVNASSFPVCSGPAAEPFVLEI